MNGFKIIQCFILLFICTCKFLFSYHKAGYQYLYPNPDANYISYQSGIIIRFENTTPDELINLDTFIGVRGGQSGYHKGVTKIASDKRTILFKPYVRFLPGETVFIKLVPQLPESTDQAVKALEYHFTVANNLNHLSKIEMDRVEDKDQYTEAKGISKVSAVAQAAVMPNGVSVPGDFPHVNITINNNPDNGYIFLNNKGGQPYTMILDNTGSPVWYWRTWDRRRDCKVQDNGVLTMMIRGGYGKPEIASYENMGYIALDHNYNVIDTIRAAFGYLVNEHELQILPDGKYLLIGQRYVPMDLSDYGGSSNATVTETSIQEFTPEGDLISIWGALDLFEISDLNFPGEIYRINDVRFSHMNAIDIDEDGHILLSSRHLSEVTKINRYSGEIIWRLGGLNNQFTFINDPLNGFSCQHDIRSLGGHRYTIFDNGNLHEPPVSRALEYEIDPDNFTATLVWQFSDIPDKYSHWKGNVQRLDNGNTLINWGDGPLPKLTEVTPEGEKIFEMNFINQYHCYRVFRFPWNGMRVTPYLIVEPYTDNITLLFNQFGDPDVAYYNIYGGTSPNPTILLASTASTLIELSELENEQYYYFRVTSVNGSGVESDFSNEEEVYVSLIPRYENMVVNGDFSDGLEPWVFEVRNADAEGVIADQFCFNIENGGPDIFSIQLRQNGIRLIEGRTYIFEFDAWADAPRTIEAKVGQDNEPWTNYSVVGYSYITEVNRHFSYEFEMNDPTDLNARIVINTGITSENVYLDNVSIQEIVLSDDTENPVTGETPFQYKLHGNYPNPFNATTIIRFDLPEESYIRIKIYNILGELVKEICSGKYSQGFHRIHFYAENLSSGIYFYTMEVSNDQNRSSAFYAIKKMILIK